ncbi:MAG: hypothetical protein B7Z80_25335 [Rhodospirillales bacterium 20-64-7]|nr:MAG: hypothetical protein B7Z80_25335 [Rhodospirillales bacterium 20-64-7]HQT75729.1 hypothetical protein [Rhodopila sp.]
MISRRFIPPAIDALREGPRYDAACERAQAREEAFAEGLRAGRQEGYAAGVRQGEEQATAAYQIELNKLHAEYARQHTIEVILNALQHLLEAREETRLALEAAARAVIHSALHALFPVLLASAAGQEIAALIGDALRERGAVVLTVRAHPDTIVSIRDQGLTDTDTLILLPDASVASGAAIATWSGGGLSFDPAEHLKQIDALLSHDHQYEEAASA